jgi:alanine-synthesizing transaminase
VNQRFSLRTGWELDESPYAGAVREARASGRKLYDLTLSNPTRCGFVYDFERLLPALASPAALSYDPQPQGLPSTREAVARYYADHRAEVSAGDVVMTTSTSESYSFLFRLLCDPGDEVLVAQPSYPLFDFLSELDDVPLRPYPLFYDGGWWIDFAELERRIGPRTRAIIVVNPNNPTGHWTGPTERERLEDLCARHNLALIVDEVFLDYPLGPLAAGSSDPPRSFASGSHPVLTFVLSGLSKVAGLPQMKAAWLLVLGPQPACAQALGRLEVIADTYLSLSAPIQWALADWLADRDAIQRQILDRARTNLSLLSALCVAEPGRLGVLHTEAGWSAVLALPACVGETDCATRLATERGVILHPGSFYSLPEPNQVVVSLIAPTEELKAGIQLAIS